MHIPQLFRSHTISYDPGSYSILPYCTVLRLNAAYAGAGVRHAGPGLADLARAALHGRAAPEALASAAGLARRALGGLAGVRLAVAGDRVTGGVLVAVASPGAIGPVRPLRAGCIFKKKKKGRDDLAN